MWLCVKRKISGEKRKRTIFFYYFIRLYIKIKTGIQSKL